MPPQETDESKSLLTSGSYGSIKVHNTEDTSSSPPPPPPPTASQRVLIKTQKSFYDDLRVLAPGSIPHSCILALTIGIVCGVVAFVYYACLYWLLDVIWHHLPRTLVVDVWPESLQFLWIPLVGFILATCLGLSVYLLGEPGDLPYTVKCVHEKGYVASKYF